MKAIAQCQEGKKILTLLKDADCGRKTYNAAFYEIKMIY
jgi:hypothetical protein